MIAAASAFKPHDQRLWTAHDGEVVEAQVPWSGQGGDQGSVTRGGNLPHAIRASLRLSCLLGRLQGLSSSPSSPVFARSGGRSVRSFS